MAAFQFELTTCMVLLPHAATVPKWYLHVHGTKMGYGKSWKVMDLGHQIPVRIYPLIVWFEILALLYRCSCVASVGQVIWGKIEALFSSGLNNY